MALVRYALWLFICFCFCSWSWFAVAFPVLNGLNAGSGWKTIATRDDPNFPAEYFLDDYDDSEWEEPCTSTSPFYLASVPDSPKIWTSNGTGIYAMFRYDPGPLDPGVDGTIKYITHCRLVVDNVVVRATYGGVDLEITNQGQPWNIEKFINFIEIDGGVLTIVGEESSQTGSCAKSGFTIDCFSLLYTTESPSTQPTPSPSFSPSNSPSSSPTRRVTSANGLRYYQYYEFPKTYEEAKQACSDAGQVLAAAFSPEDTAAIQSTMYNQQQAAWIGLNDKDVEDQFMWEAYDGVSTQYYRNFFNNEPDNGAGIGNEDCVAVFGATGNWNDLECSDRLNYVCMNRPLCSVSQYFNVTSQTCQDCAAGGKCPGNDAFVPCSQGYYCTADLEAAELPCPPGTSNDALGASSIEDCLPCRAGTYNAAVGRASCTPCSLNTYSTTEGANSSSTCQSCIDLGGFSNTEGATECGFATKCEASWFNYSATSCGADNLRNIVYFSNSDCPVAADARKTLPCSFIPFGSRLGTILLAMQGSGVILNTLILLFIVLYRKSPLIKGQIAVTISFVVAAIMINVTYLFTNLGPVSDMVCTARVSGLCLFTTLFITSLCTKARTVHQIFTNKSLVVFDKRKRKQPQIIINMVMLFTVAFLAAWVVVEPPSAGLRKSSVEMDPRYCDPVSCLPPSEGYCENIDGMFYYTYSALLLLYLVYCCFISYRARNIPESFSEAKYIMTSVYNVALMSIMLLLLDLILNIQAADAILVYGFAAVWITVVSVYIIYLPKFALIFTKSNEELARHMRSELDVFLKQSSSSSNFTYSSSADIRTAEPASYYSSQKLSSQV